MTVSATSPGLTGGWTGALSVTVSVGKPRVWGRSQSASSRMSGCKSRSTYIFKGVDRSLATRGLSDIPRLYRWLNGCLVRNGVSREPTSLLGLRLAVASMYSSLDSRWVHPCHACRHRQVGRLRRHLSLVREHRRGERERWKHREGRARSGRAWLLWMEADGIKGE